MDRISEDCLHESNRIVHGAGLSSELMSPFSCHWTYEAALHLEWASRDKSGSDKAGSREVLHTALTLGGSRWRLAGR